MPDITLIMTIFALSAEWAKEKKQSKNNSSDFLEWLKEKNIEVHNQISSNQKTLVSIKAFVNENHSSVIEKLESIEIRLAETLSDNKYSKDITLSFDKSFRLSEQALDILLQINKVSGIELKERSKNRINKVFQINTGNAFSAPLKIHDMRFFESDLNDLVDRNYLILKTKDGLRTYTITRKGADVV